MGNCGWLSYDFIPTNRSKLGVSERIGIIVVPAVPYVGFEISYDTTPGEPAWKTYLGLLLYHSPEIFLGLDLGLDSSVGYARLFASYAQ